MPYFLVMGVHVVQTCRAWLNSSVPCFPKVEILVAESLESSPVMVEVVLARVREALPDGSSL